MCQSPHSNCVKTAARGSMLNLRKLEELWLARETLSVPGREEKRTLISHKGEDEARASGNYLSRK